MYRENFCERRAHLAALSEQQLKDRFWELAEKVVAPMIELAHGHTSPSVERSVLLRMGFSSLEAKEIVDRCVEQGLLGKGAGHAVWRLAELERTDYRSAGLKLARGEGWETLVRFWKGGSADGA